MESKWKTLSTVVESKWKTPLGKDSRLPLFDLEAPPKYHLDEAPLVQALFQLRYPLIASLETMQGIAGLQAALASTFPYLEQHRVEERSYVLGPDGPLGPQTAESVRWHFNNDAGQLIVIGAGSATLSEGEGYRGVEPFRTSLAQMLDALASVRLPRCDRVGVRYLSLAEELPGQQHSWRNWFRPELVGWAGLHFVGNELQTSVNQVRLASAAAGDLAVAPAAVQADVRHGAVPKGTQIPGIPSIEVKSPAYLLELDLYTAAQQPFDAESLLEQFDALHNEIDRFFYWCLTDEGKDHFGLQIRDS